MYQLKVRPFMFVSGDDPENDKEIKLRYFEYTTDEDKQQLRIGAVGFPDPAFLCNMKHMRHVIMTLGLDLEEYFPNGFILADDGGVPNASIPHEALPDALIALGQAVKDGTWELSDNDFASLCNVLCDCIERDLSLHIG